MPKVDVTNSHGCTPLHVACNNGQDVVVDVLLQHKATINQLNIHGQTPLHYAAWSHHGALCMELLVKAGADPNVKVLRSSPISWVDGCGFYVSYLKDINGRTALHMTSVHGFYLRTETLINHGTCILCSSLSHSLSLSLSPGARVDVEDKEGNTSLHIAARHGHASVVKKLISYGANKNK